MRPLIRSNAQWGSTHERALLRSPLHSADAWGIEGNGQPRALLVSRQPLPPGFVEVAPNVFEGPRHKVGPDAYEGRIRITLGRVAQDDEGHSCDAMGCSSLGEHVIAREVLS